MSVSKVRRALEQRLALLTPVLDTAYQNVNFCPVEDQPYQEVTLLPNVPDNTAIGGLYYREQGVFQVALMYPQLAGSGDAEMRAQSIRAQFPRGLNLVQEGVNVVIDTTPAIGPSFRDRERWRVPVSISYHAEVFQ